MGKVIKMMRSSRGVTVRSKGKRQQQKRGT